MHKIVKQLLTPFIENQIFLYLKKLSENCSVNVPIELDTITRVTSYSLSYIHITQRYTYNPSCSKMQVIYVKLSIYYNQFTTCQRSTCRLSQ